MFAYCLNSPVLNFDPNGLWTFGISFGINLTLGIGFSVGIGIYFDGRGNWDFQWSYVAPGVDETASVGILDVGAGVTLQYTDRETVYDLYGPATFIGGSGGPLLYAGGDLISFSDASDITNEVNGFQLTGGVGVGIDLHVTESNTKPVVPPNTKKDSAQSSSGQRYMVTNKKTSVIVLRFDLWR